MIRRLFVVLALLVCLGVCHYQCSDCSCLSNDLMATDTVRLSGRPTRIAMRGPDPREPRGRPGSMSRSP